MRKVSISVNYSIMEFRISATELARRLGDILGRIRYRGDSFVIERNRTPMARIGPLPGARPVSVREALAAWMVAGESDATLADDLERVIRADRAPDNPWASPGTETVRGS